MSFDFLPANFERASRFTVVLPVADAPDLTEPNGRYARAVAPQRIELTLSTVELPDGADKLWGGVLVSGPRRLKSGKPGQWTVLSGMESKELRSLGGDELLWRRPDWLSDLLREHLPEGWPLEVFGLGAEA